MKVEVDKLDIIKLVNVPTSLNNLKTKLDDLDVGKLKLLKIQKLATLKTTVNNLEKKIPDGTTLIHINQFNTDKQILEKKIGDVD